MRSQAARSAAGADAVAEILVEMRRAPAPMRGDLLLDGSDSPDPNSFQLLEAHHLGQRLELLGVAGPG